MEPARSDSFGRKDCVSVGLMAIDGLHGLNHSIESILLQPECLEVYVICPHQLSEDVFEKCQSRFTDPRICFKRQDKKSYPAFVNAVSELFRGTVFAFLREGDRWTSSMLGSSLEKLNRSPQFLMTHGFADKIDIKLGSKRSFKSLRDTDDISMFANGFSIALSTSVIKRSAWLLLHGFDRSTESFFEFDFVIRAFLNFSHRIALAPRFQADIVCTFDENLAFKVYFRKVLDQLQILKRYDLQSLDFLKSSLIFALSGVRSFEELQSIREHFLIIQPDYNLSDEEQKMISKYLLLEESQMNDALSLDARCQALYKNDGLAASLISCIYPGLHSGCFAFYKGPYARYCDFRDKHMDGISRLNNSQKYAQLVSEQKLSRGFQDRPFGVNLIGHTFDVFGLGESLRMMARAFLEAGIPISIIDVPAKNGCKREQNFLESFLPDRLENSAPYAFNVICMTPASHARWLLDGGLNFTTGRYSIGAWFWETSTWPEPWTVLFKFVDSAWPASELIKSALEKGCRGEHLLLTKMPFPAEIRDCESFMLPGRRINTRRHFGIPLDRVVFVFGFDVKSSLERKNPLACIRVFNEAFGDPSSGNFRQDVCLVIKTFVPRSKSRAWSDLLDIVSYDDRIILIVESLKREDLLALYAACDIFLSLHRSEGYGLGMAEAFQLGLKVIASNYGGNTDFCSGASSYLVQTQQVPIGPGMYPFANGHSWAEPDLDHAAKLCIAACFDMHQNLDLQEESQRVDNLFSIAAAGQAYKSKLCELYESIPTLH